MLYLFLNLGFTAVAPIIIYFWGKDINHDIMIFISALTAVSSFHLLNFGQNKATYQQLIHNHKLKSGFAKVILTTTFMWIAGFLIPGQYTPFIFVFSYLGWPGFFGAIVMAKNSRKPESIIQAGMILLTFIAFYLVTFHGYTVSKTAIGIVITTLTGLSLYLYLRASKELNTKGINSRQILAIRYWLLLLLPLIVIIYKHEFGLITSVIMLKGIIIGLVTLVLPLYFGQLCIERFGSEKFSLAMGVTPILTFILQFFTLKTEFSQVMLALTLALAIGMPLLIKIMINYKIQICKPVIENK